MVQSRLCPYLDTINRTVLDFDFEKLCSVSLTRINVYACLVCGKYFQGQHVSIWILFQKQVFILNSFFDRERTQYTCLPPQCWWGTPCFPQFAYLEILLLARQLWNHWFLSGWHQICFKPHILTREHSSFRQKR